KTGGKIEHASRRERGDFAEAQAECKTHVSQPALLLKNRVQRQSVNEERGLADPRLRELVLGALERNLCEIPAENVIRLRVKGARRGGSVMERLPHADL